MLIDTPPQRIVSLVPSMTESLFNLGFGKFVVGITDYCIHPNADVDRLPRVGGPKNPRIEDILKLHPDLVIANQEENSQQTVSELIKNGISTWLTFPKTVDEAIADLWSLARLFRSENAQAMLRMIEKSVEYARMAAQDQPAVRYFCPIWYEIDPDGSPWWMTFNQDTFTNDLLSVMGGENVFSARERRYPIAADLGLALSEPSGDRDIRYPRVRLQDIIHSRPDVILLPDEPYPFGEKEAERLIAEFRDSANIDLLILHVEGSLITWPGTRIATAISELAPEFTKLTNRKDGATL